MCSVVSCIVSIYCNSVTDRITVTSFPTKNSQILKCIKYCSTASVL